MEKRILGRSDLAIAPIMLGGNVFGWTADAQTSFRILDAFVDAGFNAVDTADVYSSFAPGLSGGESETVIGAWLASRGGRDRIVLSTKCGMSMGPGRSGLSAGWITQAVEDSLKRLQTDHIDLYQAHQDDPGTPMEETLEAFSGLVDQGKVRWLGASNFRAERLAQAVKLGGERGWPRYESLQPEYNLYNRAGFEKDLREVCLREDIGVITYFSLAAGFLTGKYRSKADLGQSPRGAWAEAKLNPRGLRILSALDFVAAAHAVSTAQIALAWLLAQPGVTAPIVSAKSVEQLDDILGAAGVVLDETEIAALTAASGED